MIIRKLTFAPDEAGPQPTAEVARDFLMSLGSLRVEASLDKQVGKLLQHLLTLFISSFYSPISIRIRLVHIVKTRS